MVLAAGDDREGAVLDDVVDLIRDAENALRTADAAAPHQSSAPRQILPVKRAVGAVHEAAVSVQGLLEIASTSTIVIDPGLATYTGASIPVLEAPCIAGFRIAGFSSFLGVIDLITEVDVGSPALGLPEREPD